MTALLTPLMVCLVSSSFPDGGALTIARSHQVRWLPDSPAQAFRTRVDVETFTVPNAETHFVESLTLTLPDGGTTPELERINQALRAPYDDDHSRPPEGTALADGSAGLYRDLERRLAREDFQGTQNITAKVVHARGPFVLATVCVDFIGAYPSINCQDFRYRVDTGATWSWEDVIAKPKRAAFLALCRDRLQAAAKAERARLAKAHLEPWEEALSINCVPEVLNDFQPRADGGLSFTVFRGPHASAGYTFGFDLSAKDVAALAGPKGPFGPPGRRR